MKEKTLLRTKFVRQIKLPHFIELSTKVIIDEGYIPKAVVKEYLPDDADKTDRNFVWGVWYSLKAEDADKYYHSVLAKQVEKDELVKLPSVKKDEKEIIPRDSRIIHWDGELKLTKEAIVEFKRKLALNDQIYQEKGNHQR